MYTTHITKWENAYLINPSGQSSRVKHPYKNKKMARTDIRQDRLKYRIIISSCSSEPLCSVTSVTTHPRFKEESRVHSNAIFCWGMFGHDPRTFEMENQRLSSQVCILSRTLLGSPKRQHTQRACWASSAEWTHYHFSVFPLCTQEKKFRLYATSRRRRRITFQRYVVGICDQVIICDRQ